MWMPSRPQNRLLASLRLSDFQAVEPYLESLILRQSEVLCSAGSQIDRVYFPDSGIISVVVELTSRRAIEVAMIGRDSVYGAMAALDDQVAISKAIVQLAGEALTLDVTRFRKIAENSPQLRQVLVRHDQALLVQAQQSAACNASHALEARLARWLLRAHDLCDGDTLALTQEFLAQMLGVQRSSVSNVANTLQRAGLIEYSRGRVKIKSLKDLQHASCDCYGVVKAHYDRLAGV
jgi:CRP-like cAMP-binding protein